VLPTPWLWLGGAGALYLSLTDYRTLLLCFGPSELQKVFLFPISGGRRTNPNHRRKHSMDMKEVMEHVRRDLRARPDSHFSEIYFRLTECKVSHSDVHTALYEMLKRDEVVTTIGKWRLATPATTTKSALKRQHRSSLARFIGRAAEGKRIRL
jgi:hypothetical protein